MKRVLLFLYVLAVCRVLYAVERHNNDDRIIDIYAELHAAVNQVDEVASMRDNSRLERIKVLAQYMLDHDIPIARKDEYGRSAKDHAFERTQFWSRRGDLVPEVQETKFYAAYSAGLMLAFFEFAQSNSITFQDALKLNTSHATTLVKVLQELGFETSQLASAAVKATLEELNHVTIQF